MGKRIYLAGPYSHLDRDVRLERFHRLNEVAAKFMQSPEDHVVFSPISMTHPIAEQHELPLNWEFWERNDRAFIDWCELLVVVKLPGWQESVGVKAEIAIANELGKPVVYLEP
jgi:hypothetical protein